jgi:hypothetical protein
LGKPNDAQRNAASASLATARYIHNVLGDLAKLAQQSQLEAPDVMILAAWIEALGALRRLRVEPGITQPSPRGDHSTGR